MISGMTNRTMNSNPAMTGARLRDRLRSPSVTGCKSSSSGFSVLGNANARILRARNSSTALTNSLTPVCACKRGTSLSESSEVIAVSIPSAVRMHAAAFAASILGKIITTFLKSWLKTYAPLKPQNARRTCNYPLSRSLQKEWTLNQLTSLAEKRSVVVNFHPFVILFSVLSSDLQ